MDTETRAILRRAGMPAANQWTTMRALLGEKEPQRALRNHPEQMARWLLTKALKGGFRSVPGDLARGLVDRGFDAAGVAKPFDPKLVHKRVARLLKP